MQGREWSACFMSCACSSLSSSTMTGTCWHCSGATKLTLLNKRLDELATDLPIARESIL